MSYPIFLFLMGAIWMAPHIPKDVGLIFGLTIMIVAVVAKYGWNL